MVLTEVCRFKLPPTGNPDPARGAQVNVDSNDAGMITGGHNNARNVTQRLIFVDGVNIIDIPSLASPLTGIRCVSANPTRCLEVYGSRVIAR